MKEVKFSELAYALDYLKLLAKPVPSSLPPLSLYKPKLKDPIVNGDPVRIPVDRVAARVTSPGPEWAHYIPPAIKDERYADGNRKEKAMDRTKNYDPVGNDLLSQGAQPPSGKYLIGKKKDADFNVEVANASVKQFTKSVADSEDLVKRAEEATAAIDYLTTHIRKEWAEYDDYIIGALKKVRATKVAIEIETKQTLAALGDLRKFFLDPRHEEEVKKLSEFVDLCDRLRELRKSGFLDAVCDTILRMEE